MLGPKSGELAATAGGTTGDERAGKLRDTLVGKTPAAARTAAIDSISSRAGDGPTGIAAEECVGLILPSAGEGDHRVRVEKSLGTALGAARRPHPKRSDDLAFGAMLRAAGAVEAVALLLKRSEPSGSTILKLIGVHPIKSGRQSGGRPGMKVLGIDRQPTPRSLQRHRPSATEGVRDPVVGWGSVEDPADQRVRASCPPAEQRDCRRVDLSIALLARNLNVQGRPIDGLQEGRRWLSAHEGQAKTLTRGESASSSLATSSASRPRPRPRPL